MKAITVREPQGKLIAFGPDNGMYDPGVPVGSTKAIEDDYDKVLAEYQASLPPLPTPDEIEQEHIKKVLSRIEKDPALLKRMKAMLDNAPA